MPQFHPPDNYSIVLDLFVPHKESIATTKQAIKIFRKNNDKDSLAQAYMNLANTYHHLTDWEKAEFYWKKGNKLIHSNTDLLLITSSYNTRGIILKAKNKYRLAQQAFVRGIETGKTIHNPDLLTNLYLNLSSTQLQLHQFEKGNNNLAKAISLANTNSTVSPYTIAQLDELSANYYIQEGKYKEAKQKLQSALKLFSRLFGKDSRDAISVQSLLDELKNDNAAEYTIQTSANRLFYSFKEYVNIFNELYKHTIELFGNIKVISTQQQTLEHYVYDYQFFIFTKCCKSYKAFSALINKETQEDAFSILYTIYRNYLTLAFLNKNPDQVYSFIDTPVLVNTGQIQRDTDKDGVIDALSYLDNKTNKKKPLYYSLRELVKFSPYPEDKILHNYFDPFLSDYAFSNFSITENMRSADLTHYNYSAKENLIYALHLGLYFQLLIIQEIGQLIVNEKWKTLVNKFIAEATPLLIARIELAYKEDNWLVTAMIQRLKTEKKP